MVWCVDILFLSEYRSVWCSEIWIFCLSGSVDRLCGAVNVVIVRLFCVCVCVMYVAQLVYKEVWFELCTAEQHGLSRILNRIDAWCIIWSCRYAILLVIVPLPLRLNPKTVHYNIHDHILPGLKIWPFKSQVSAAAVALFNWNAQSGRVFFFCFTWKWFKLNIIIMISCYPLVDIGCQQNTAIWSCLLWN